MIDIDAILDDAFTAVFGQAFTGAATMKRDTRKQRAERIARHEAASAGVNVTDIYSHTRIHKIAHCRQSVMYRLRKDLGWSLEHIGRHLGGRDHTTVLHGIRAHERRLKEE